MNSIPADQQGCDAMGRDQVSVAAARGERPSGPLCVDLDGTLVRTDLLFESLVAALRRAPWIVFLIPVWIVRGKQHLKEALAQRSDLDASVLPYHPDVLQIIDQARADDRRVVLVTGNSMKLARQVQDHLGVFDDLLASDSQTNLTGKRKARLLGERYGSGAYEYVANATVDIPVWNDAGAVTTVSASGRVARRVSAMGKPHRHFPRASRGLRVWLKALRVHQWVKNALIFVPLVTAHRVTDVDAMAAAFLAFLCFGLCASATYIVNDILDLDSDRHHRTKCTRPFAAGTLSIPAGVLASAGMLGTSFVLSFALPLGFQIALLGYVISTLAYSIRLKRVASLDVLVLAGLYTLRVIAGAFATGIPLSFWLLAFSMFIFLCLAIVKREAELIELRDQHPGTAQNEGQPRGREYTVADIPILQAMGTSSGYLSVLVLALYINSTEVSGLYRSPEILWLIAPLLLLWVTRLWILTTRGHMNEDPIVFAIKDPETWVTAAATAAILAAATTLSL